MTATIIILAYIANVFLNRWLNKVLYKRAKDIYPIIPLLWFIPIASTFEFITTGAIVLDFKFKRNWFTGKNW